MGAYQLILVALLALTASIIQSIAGFGFGILAMIFLPHILLYTEANVLSTMLSLMTSLVVAITLRKKISKKNIIFPVIGFFISMVLSVNLVKAQRNETLFLLLGIALFALSIYFLFFSNKVKIKPTWYAGIIAGLCSGVMGAFFSMSGPPAVVYFAQSEEDSDKYLATVSAYFFFADSISATAKMSAGFATKNVFIAFAIGITGMALGSVIGKRFRNKIKPDTLKKLIYGLMAVGGVVNIVTSLI